MSEEGTQTTEKSQERDYEAEAREQGWVPKDDYKGDPEAWRDARTFVKRGEEFLPVVKSQNRKLQKELEEAKSEIAEMKATAKEFQDYMSKTEKRAFDKALKEIEAKQRKAAQDGDVTAFDEAQKDAEKLRKNQEEQVKPAEPKDDPVFKKWVEDTGWYGTDKKKTAQAEAIASGLLAEQTALRGRELLDEVAKQVAELNPEPKNTKRDAPPKVGSGGSKGGTAGKTYADLPAEAKATCDRFVRNGYFKGDTLEKQRAEYVKNFDWGAA
ncbi:MAG: hypothetical protein AAF607_10175 [Pseudomonadota bacterium]